MYHNVWVCSYACISCRDDLDRGLNPKPSPVLNSPRALGSFPLQVVHSGMGADLYWIVPPAGGAQRDGGRFLFINDTSASIVKTWSGYLEQS